MCASINQQLMVVVQEKSMTITVSNMHHMYLRRKPNGNRQMWRRAAIVAIALAFVASLLVWLAQYGMGV